MKKTLTNLAIGAAFCAAGMSSALAVDNPFVGADSYINPDYVKQVETFFDKEGNEGYREKADQLGLLNESGVWKIPTAIWLDSIDAIYGEKGRSQSLATYLEDARQQSIDTGKPVVMSVVVYNLPLRDCAAFSSNGKLTDVGDLEAKYMPKYIDEIRDIFREFYTKPNSNNVRLALIIEPDSLPNMITNVNSPTAIPTCELANDNKVYTRGIEYALKEFARISDEIIDEGDKNQLKPLPNAKGNIAMYLDIAHSGWLGWDSNANKITQFYNNSKAANGQGIGKGFDFVRGFITNTSNYTPTQEAFTYDEYLRTEVNGATRIIRNTDFYEWNLAYDEATYVAEIMSLDSANGRLTIGNKIQRPATPYYNGKHFLIDTSRNGWITNTTDYVGSSGWSPNDRGLSFLYPRKDQRHHRGNWCNAQFIQPVVTSYDNPEKIALPRIPTSSGLGERPTVNPDVTNPIHGGDRLPLDAYVWIKPPGESDGFYDGVKGDKMCGGPSGNGEDHNGFQKTDSLQSEDGSAAPEAGHWFERAFKRLIDTSVCIEGKPSCGT